MGPNSWTPLEFIPPLMPCHAGVLLNLVYFHCIRQASKRGNKDLFQGATIQVHRLYITGATTQVIHNIIQLHKRLWWVRENVKRNSSKQFPSVTMGVEIQAGGFELGAVIYRHICLWGLALACTSILRDGSH